MATEQISLTRQLEESVAASRADKQAHNPVGLRQKLLAIMRECSYIQKDKENSFHRYRYASEAAIKEKLHSALVRYGVLFQCDVVSFDERTGLGKDGKETLAKCQFHYAFEDVETGDKREGTFFGTGVDNADKHLYKAVTGAVKYILTTTFLIPTGDDPEGEEKLTKAEAKAKQKEVADRRLEELGAKGAQIRDVGKPQQIITDAQRKRMYTIATKEAKLSKEDTKLILDSYGFTSSTEVTVDKYDSICNDIQRCAEYLKQLPIPQDYVPGNHIMVNGVIHRLTDEDRWEPLGTMGV